eukprot:10076535-Ditylum_brightwellii.AAC.1
MSYSVPSGVSDRPHAWDATVKDAEEESDAEKKPDFAVGLEGGVEELHIKGDDDDKNDEKVSSIWRGWLLLEVG